MRKLQHQKIQCALAILTIVVFASNSFAATINVDTTNDLYNDSGDDCSVREAIVSANRDTFIDGCTSGDGPDTIIIPAGTYTIGGGACELITFDEECFDLDIESNIILQGSTTGQTILDAGGGIGHRVLEIRSNESMLQSQGTPLESITATFNNLIMQNGYDELGGCVFSNGSEVNITATFNDTTLQQCFACIGGGLFNLLSDTRLNRSHVDENTGYFIGGGIASGAGLLLDLIGFLPDNAKTAMSDEIAALGPIEEYRGSLTVADNSTVSNNNGTLIASQAESLCDSIPPLFIAGGIASALTPLTITDSKVNQNNLVDLTGIITSLEDISGGLLVGGILRFNGVTEIRNSEVNGNNGLLLAGGVLSVALDLGEVMPFGDDDDDLPEPDSFTIVDSTIDGNTGWLTGGGIVNIGPMSVTGSTISRNRTLGGLGFPTGLEFLFGGGGVVNFSSFDALNSTFSGNISEYGAGGAFLHSPLTEFILPGGLTLGAQGEGDDDDNFEVPQASFHNCTFTGNITERGQAPEIGAPVSLYEIEPGIGAGGGIAVNFGDVLLRNTIVAGNQDANACDVIVDDDDDDNMAACEVEEQIFAPDCYVAPCTEMAMGLGCEAIQGRIVSEGYNLIGNNAGCTFTADSTDKVGTEAAPINAKLGGLSDNGGNTLTHHPASDSPAVDMSNPSPVVAALTQGEVIQFACPNIDQRGVVRPQDGNLDGVKVCDIGAVEGIFDCAGVANGLTVPDICGVCGGDGSTAQEFNLEPTKLTIDGTGAAQLKVHNAAVRAADRTLLRACGKGLTKQKKKQLRQEAAELYSGDGEDMGIWASTATIPGEYLECSDPGPSAICVQVSTSAATDEILADSGQFAVLLKNLEKNLKRDLKACGADVKANLKRFNLRLKQNDELYAEMQEAVATVPNIVTECAPGA